MCSLVRCNGRGARVSWLGVLAARWLGLSAHAGRHFYLATASLSILGYHHDLDEPVIHLWNAWGAGHRVSP